MSIPSLLDGVSPVLPKDYVRVVEVWEASVRATHTFVHEEDIVAFRKIIQEGLPNSRDLRAMRDVDEQVVGFSNVDDGEVAMLFVHPDYRAQGVGKRLMRFAVNALGATKVDVNEQNEQALGFYLHLGFEVVDRSELDGTGRPYPILHLQLASMEPKVEDAL